ncbi:MAG TPA: hypothetical protein VD993_09600 [Chitinophagaceae bacterium]|nr:hypothetical protein [Chitinophagaceae bacterium]
MAPLVVVGLFFIPWSDCWGNVGGRVVVGSVSNILERMPNAELDIPETVAAQGKILLLFFWLLRKSKRWILGWEVD